MARLLRASQNAIRLSSSSSSSSFRIQFLSFLHQSSLPLNSRKVTSTSAEVSETVPKSPIEANIVRVLRNEIQYQSEYAPTHQVWPFSPIFISFTITYTNGLKNDENERKFICRLSEILIKCFETFLIFNGILLW